MGTLPPGLAKYRAAQAGKAKAPVKPGMKPAVDNENAEPAVNPTAIKKQAIANRSKAY